VAKEQTHAYLRIYEIETEDPASVLAEVGKRSVSGKMKTSDALDAKAAILWIYKLHEMKR
jgi:hypothetical protein